MPNRTECLIALVILIIMVCANCTPYSPTTPVDFEYMERKVERWHQQQERAHWSRHHELHRKDR